MYTILTILTALVVFFLLLPFTVVLLQRFVREKVVPTHEKPFDYGCIITAYRDAHIARGLVQSLLNQNHPHLHIYLVADKCDISDWDLEDERLHVFKPEPDLNLKAKSIIYAVERYVRPHDYTVIFDADNLAHPNFLTEIDRYARAGCRSIQGQRTAKNLDTFYANADAMGEFYKNYTERYSTYMIGSSSVISGSGMAIETELYKSYLYGPEISAGKEKWKKMLQEDKILQNHLLDLNERIAYAQDAVIYDEKVNSGDAVETQRSRWLYSYFQNVPNSSRILFKGLFGFNWNQLVFGLVTIAPPMFVQLLIAGVLFVINLVFAPTLAVAVLIAGLIFSATILWSLKLSAVPKSVWSAVWGIPMFVVRQFTALLKMTNPNKNFKHTEHKHSVSIDEVLERGKK